MFERPRRKDRDEPWPVKAAKYAWMSFIALLLVPTCLSVVLANPSGGGHPDDEAITRMLPGIFALLLMLSGIAAGAASLCAMGTYGKRGIMVPAITGICLHVGFVLLAVIVLLPALQAAREAARQMHQEEQERQQRQQQEQPPDAGHGTP